MAEQASQHDASSLSTYLRVLRRRKWIVIVCALLVPLAAFFFSARQEKIYQSSAEVYLNKQDIGSALTGIDNQTLFVDEDRAAETQVNLASVPAVAKLALRNAGINDMTPDDLLAEASVASKGLSDILEFTITDPDPKRAERLATAYALAFTQYRGQIDSASTKTARQEVERKLAQLEADGKKGTALYDSLVESEQQLATLETLKTSRVSVVRNAEEAFLVAPTPKRNAILGLALGLVLGVGLAFAIDALDTRVRSATEIGEQLDLPLLARVPPPPKGFGKENRLVMLAQPTGTSAEAFRMLRTNLDFARLEGEDVRVILVTSAVEEEGKSTTAANLALAEARGGRRVALVDLDLRRPFVDRFFGLLHAEGITNVALGTIPLEQALHRIDLAVGAAAKNGRAALPEANGHAERGSLDVLVSGPLPPDPGEFVGTKKLVEILARLRAAYDLVIVDTPPALRVGDALALSAKADGVLVVSRLNVVRRPMLRELRRALDTAPAPKLGLVVTGSGGGDAVGYGYGDYRYGGYGYGDPEQARRGEDDGARCGGREARECGEGGRSGLTAIEQTLAPSAPLQAEPAGRRRVAFEDLVDERTRELIRGRRIGKTHRRGWIVRRALLAADVAGLVLAFAFAEVLFGNDGATNDKVASWVEFLGFLVTIPMWLVLARLLGLYDSDEEHADHTTVDDAVGVFLLVTVGAWLLIALAWVTKAADPYMPKLLTFWLTAIALVALIRAVARSRVRRTDAYVQNTIVVGAGDIAQLLGSKILRHPEYGINLLGFVDKQPKTRRDDIGDLTMLGDIADLPRIVDELDVERVVVAFVGQDQGKLLEDLRPLRSKDVQIDVVPRFFDIVGPGADFHAIEGFPLIGLPPARLPWSSLMLKRALDLFGSAVGLILLSPLFLFVAIRIKLDSPGPVFYRHERVGRGGKRIDVFKFRSMRKEFSRGDRYGGEEAEQAFADLMADPERQREFETNYKLQDDPRVTRFGAFMRRTSIDELPQLINVLVGDLSLVGPRPITRAEIERYGAAGEELLNVKPGITGYWQINGRSDLDYADRVRLDLAYVGDWSLGLDLTILGKTIRALAAGRGAY